MLKKLNFLLKLEIKMTQTLEENLGRKILMGYGGESMDNPIYFLYTQSGTTVESFLRKSQNSKSFREFVDSIQKAFSSLETQDIDKTYQNSYEARRTGKALGILGIEECVRYIISNSLTGYLKLDNPDLNKVRDYSTQFNIEFEE